MRILELIWRGRLSGRVMTTLSLMALTPLLFVVLTPAWRWGTERWMRRDLAAAAALLERRPGPQALAEAAARGRGSARQLDDALELEAQAGHTFQARWTNDIARHFVPDPDLAEVRQAEAALTDESGQLRWRQGCALIAQGRAFVCRHTVVPEGAPGPVVLQTGMLPTATRLRSSPLQVTASVLQLLIVAAILGLLLVGRVVGPLRRLRREVLARAQEPVSTEPIPEMGPDEVGEVGQAFNELLGALEDQRQANLEYMSRVAHDLKTPIATVRALAELLEESEDPRTQRASGALRRSSDRLRAQVDELLELARAEAGLPDQPRAPIPLDELATNLVARYREDPRHEDLEFDVLLEAAGPRARVEGIARALELAAGNLLENAAHFATSRVIVRLESGPGAELRLAVEDDGPGVDPEDARAIFERFHTGRPGGTGLGLAMARAIARAHGATLDLEQREGPGARFVLRWPAGDA